jgi:hypothetical protein
MNFEKNEIEKKFHTLFAEWEKVIQSPEISYSSRPREYIDNEPYRSIVKMGSEVLPLLIEKLEEGVFLLNQAIIDITGAKEEVIYGKERRFLSEQEKSKYLIKWWNLQK